MERELLFRITAKDFDITATKGSGPGGQHRNKVATGQRFKHRASGAVGESTEHRSQMMNKQAAFRKCVETREFQAWLRTACAEAMGRPSTDEMIAEAMAEANIITQVLHNDRWVTVDPSLLTQGDQ